MPNKTSAATPDMLEGVTILELGGVIAGNFGGVILADLGAEVIKIEPMTGDTARNPKIAPYEDHSAIHLFMNRGKKSIVLDLKSEDGLAVLQGLVAQADVVVDNFRPGVLGRLGIDHQALKAINPRIITVSITGFGETGPQKEKAAFDLVIQAYSGHMSITGEADGAPARIGAPMADMSGAIYACISILAALAGRELHSPTTGAETATDAATDPDGRGVDGSRHVDVAMLDSMVHLLAYDALDYLTAGNPAKSHGSAHAHMVPWQAFPASDGHVVVAARDEKFWLNLCTAIEREDLRADARTVDNAARVANRDWLVPELEATFANKTKAEWVRILDENDIPSAPVNDFGSLFSDPQIEERGMIRTYDHPTLGPISYQPSPMKVDGWEFPNRHAPMLGEHTREVLAERLGFDDDQIDAMAAAGAVKVWSASR